MRDPGRRLAAERGPRAVQRILLRRLRPELPIDVDPDLHLPALLETGMLQWRSIDGAGSPFVWDAEYFAATTRAFSKFGIVRDCRLITPDGPEPWFPWLRRRVRDRRRHVARGGTVRES